MTTAAVKPDFETRTIEHRGRLLQVHVQPWGDDKPDAPQHVHVQELEGEGNVVGEHLHFDSPRARALGRDHPELAELGWESNEERRQQAEAAAAAARATAEQSAEDARIEAAVQRILSQREAPSDPPDAPVA